MNKILPILIALMLPCASCFAKAEEVKLELPQTASFVAEVKSNNNPQEKTLREKLEDIYHLEIEQIAKPEFLLTSILTKECKKESVWDSFHLWGGYVAHTDFVFNENEFENAEYLFDAINIGIDGKLKNNNGDFRLMLHNSPTSNRPFAQNLFADAYIATNKIPHHRFWLGNTRPRVGFEGGYSPYALPFMSRAQIARNFGSVRRLGARVTGNYSLVDYDLGIYDSSTYFQSFMPGTQFIGWVNFKPLGLTDGKYGKLDIGGGVQTGSQDTSYRVAGAYAGYEYKKWLINFEYSDADGYNGPIGYVVDKKANGFYSTLAYRITPKVQALVRYDEFDPNKHIANNKKREYTAGINYFIKGQALKLVLNYVFCQNEGTKNAHRLILGTQILL